MRKEIILANLTFIILLGCNNVTNNNEIKPSYSVEVSTIPTYSPTPLPVIEDKSKDQNYYCGNAYFKDNFDNEINNPRIEKPYDVSVSNDGKKLYFTKYNGIFDCKTYGGNELKTYIDREFIYKIEDNKVQILKLDDSYDYSKSLNSHIEIDKDNNLFVVKSDVNKKPPYNIGLNISNQELFKITNNKDISKKIALKKEEHIGYNYSVNQLNVSKSDNNITYSIIPFRLELNKTANKINENNSIDSLYIASSYIASFIFEDNKLNFGTSYYQGKYPYIDSPNSSYEGFKRIVPLEKNLAIRTMRMNSKKEIFALAYTKGVEEINRIYKIVPDKGFEVFAGSTEDGYKDGNGSDARFNNPSSIDFDANDNMYVADTGNNAIRKITPNGDVTTFFKQN